ncbi:MAG: transcriptional regulator [Frankia sp.]|nr:transcriptional regulator [Frankia sp.]
MPTDNAQACAHPLAFVRAQRGWSYQKLARVVAKRARDLGVANMAAERQKVWRWEHRGVVPDRVSQLALATELGVPTERLESHPWPTWLPTGDNVRTDYPWTESGSITALTDVVQDALTDRRGFLTISGSGVAALAREWLTLEPAQLVGAIEGGLVDEQIVHRIAHNIPGLRVMDERLGGESVRRLVDAELGVVTELLARGRYSERIGRQLHRVAAELARFAGWVSFDAGYQTAAQRYWVTALHAAHVGGDRLLGANVLKDMALQCIDFSRPGEALELAEAAVVTAEGSTGRVGAMLHMRKARAHAALGDQVSCARELGVAEAAFADAQPNDPAWAVGFDEAEFHAQVGCCYIDLGHLNSADRWLASGLRLHPRERTRDRATYLLHRAAVQLDMGNLDHGCDLTTEALPLLSMTRSKRNARRADEVRRRLRRHGSSPTARSLDQQLAELA